MRVLWAAALCLALAGCQAKKSASLHIDPNLESLVPDDTVAVVGANLDAVRGAAVYQKLQARLPLAPLEEFSRRTGLDPRKDLSQALFCWDGKHGLLLARGKFRTADLEAHLKSNGAAQFDYKSAHLFGNERSAVVFLDDSTAAAGPAAQLRALIDRGASGHGLPPPLADLLRALPGNDQIYAALIGGLQGLELSAPNAGILGNLSQVLQAVDTAALGLDLNPGLDVILRVNSKTERDAKFVHDMVRGLVGFGRLNAPENQPELLKLYDAIQVTQQQTLTVIKADVPADQVDRVLVVGGGIAFPNSSSPAFADIIPVPGRNLHFDIALHNAWQPSRERRVKPAAMSSRSARRRPFRIRFSMPLFTMTWQVVQAQFPPQACSNWIPEFRQTSRIDSACRAPDREVSRTRILRSSRRR